MSRCLPTVFSLNDELHELKKTLNEAVDKMAKVEVRLNLCTLILILKLSWISIVSGGGGGGGCV